MLETPFVQPVAKPASTTTTGNRDTSAQNTKSDGTEADFEAEYEASQSDTVSKAEQEVENDEAIKNDQVKTDDPEITTTPNEELPMDSDENTPLVAAPNSPDPVDKTAQNKPSEIDKTSPPDAPELQVTTVKPSNTAPQVARSNPDAPLADGRAIDVRLAKSMPIDAAKMPPQDTSKKTVKQSEALPAGGSKSVAENLFSSATLTTEKPNHHSVGQTAVGPATPSQPSVATASAAIASGTLAPLAQQDATPGKRETKSQLLRAIRDEPMTQMQSPGPSGQNNAFSPVQGLAMSHQQASFKLAQTGDRVDLVSTPSADLDAPMPWETRANAGTNAQTVQQILTRAETPTMIGRQMAEALQRNPDKPVEVSLNPRELGRVRMSISAAEAGITVSVLAERPETLDLMRRNIDQLAREFQAIGYESINFAFAEGNAQQDAQAGNDQNRADINLASDDPLPEDIVTPVQQTAVASGLDLRL